MLTPQQQAHFNIFGFLLLKQCFTECEMAAFIDAAEALWATDPEPEANGERRLNCFVERRPDLTRLAADDRLYRSVESLLGADFIWVGSEGNISNKDYIKWHADRKYYRSGEEQWIDFPQVKAMLYLEKLTRDTGCLRVIPGSHRMPLHKDLAAQEIDPEARPFGVAPQDVPCVPLETAPGDMILFHHCIWHSTFGGGKRRYIALKFAAAPRTPDQLDSLQRYSPDVFNPHDAFVHSDQPRLRRMVDRMPAYAAGRLEP